MNNYKEQTKQQIKELISTTVSNRWINNKFPLLTSEIGSIIDSSFPNYKAIIHPLRIIQFIKVFCEEDVNIVYHPTQTAKIGLIPSSIDKPQTENEIIELFSGSKSNNIEISKYDRSVWLAFIKKPSYGKFRFLYNLDDIPRFDDFTSKKDESDGYYLIEGSDIYINYKNTLEDKQTVEKKIIEWASKNGINSKSLIENNSSSCETISNKITFKSFLSKLENLSANDLATIQIPLSVVKKILS